MSQLRLGRRGVVAFALGVVGHHAYRSAQGLLTQDSGEGQQLAPHRNRRLLRRLSTRRYRIPRQRRPPAARGPAAPRRAREATSVAWLQATTATRMLARARGARRASRLVLCSNPSSRWLAATMLSESRTWPGHALPGSITMRAQPPCSPWPFLLDALPSNRPGRGAGEGELARPPGDTRRASPEPPTNFATCPECVGKARMGWRRDQGSRKVLTAEAPSQSKGGLARSLHGASLDGASPSLRAGARHRRTHGPWWRKRSRCPRRSAERARPRPRVREGRGARRYGSDHRGDGDGPRGRTPHGTR